MVVADKAYRLCEEGICTELIGRVKGGKLDLINPP